MMKPKFCWSSLVLMWRSDMQGRWYRHRFDREVDSQVRRVVTASKHRQHIHFLFGVSLVWKRAHMHRTAPRGSVSAARAQTQSCGEHELDPSCKHSLVQTVTDVSCPRLVITTTGKHDSLSKFQIFAGNCPWSFKAPEMKYSGQRGSHWTAAEETLEPGPVQERSRLQRQINDHASSHSAPLSHKSPVSISGFNLFFWVKRCSRQ